MTAKTSTQIDPNAIATSDDVRYILGALDDMTVAQILAVKPALQDLSDAALWHRGDGDLIAREHREIAAGAQAVIDILALADEEALEDEP